MIRTVSRWAKPLGGALALLVALALASPPCLAGEATPPRPISMTPLADATAAKLASLKPAAEVALVQAAAPTATTESRPFFKSPKGVAVLLLMATGITWAAVSRSKDAVHSPGRK